MQVFAVEASGLHSICRQIVEVNDLSEVITVIHSTIEDCQLPVDSVDVIVSEWMGFYLLHESMLDSVIFAKNKWLAHDGILVPSSASLLFSPVCLKAHVKENISIWDKFHGFNFSPLKDLVLAKHMTQPTVMTVKPSELIAEPREIVSLHLKHAQTEDIASFKEMFEFKISKHALCHGFGVWFKCTFDTGAADCCIVNLDTSPHADVTHWKQTVVMLPDTLMLSKDENLSCSISFEQSKENKRHYNIGVEIHDDVTTEESESETECPGELCDNDAMVKCIVEKME